MKFDAVVLYFRDVLYTYACRVERASITVSKALPFGLNYVTKLLNCKLTVLGQVSMQKITDTCT